jgi:hypothetical protein
VVLLPVRRNNDTVSLRMMTPRPRAVPQPR